VITDAAGNKVWEWQNSDPFGNNVPNENPSGLGTFKFPLRFMGQVSDPETNTFYNFYRDAYDPALDRYTQFDPIGLRGGINGYTYVGGNPISRIDPQGLSWSESASMAWDWASGTGPSSRTYGSGSSPVNEMMNAPGVQAARQLYDQKNKNNKGCDCKDALPVTNFAASFGLSGLWNAGLNPTQQFVGSYRVDIYPEPGCKKKIVISNTSSFRSFAYGIFPDWARSTFGPMGNMSQTYSWTE
jgi:RHS repeat-associated protein